MRNSEALPRRVVCAAIKKDDLIICGPRHFDFVMQRVLQELGYSRMTDSGLEIIKDAQDFEQGFVDQFGQFMTREEALVVARERSQISRRFDFHAESRLYSENLY